MRSNARYMLDFQLIPDLVRKTGPELIRRCKSDREAFISTLFNYILIELAGQSDSPYTPDQFRVSEYGPQEGTHLLYVELPPAGDSTSVCCTAYAVTYSESPAGIRNMRFFSVERSVFGTTCIGTMTEDGTHINYGSACDTPEENAEKILRLAANAG